MTSESRPASRTDGAGEHRHGGDDVGVLGGDALHHPLAHAVPAEDLLGEHRPGHQSADAVGEQRRHRDQRGAQAVLEQRLPPGQALGAGGADEVLAEHVQHRVALIAAVAGDAPQRQRERRQDQVLQPVDELVPPPADGVGRGLADVLEQLHAEYRIHPRAASINRVAMTNTGVLSNSSDSTVMTRSLRSVLPDRSPRADDHADQRAQHRTDDQQPQADPDAAPSSSEMGWPVMVVPKSPRTAPDAQCA